MLHSAWLTSVVIDCLRDLVPEVSRVGMKLVPLLRRLVSSLGSSVVVKLWILSRLFSFSCSCRRCCFCLSFASSSRMFARLSEQSE